MKDKLQATKELIDTQLELKYIEESCSPRNSIFVIKMKSNKWHLFSSVQSLSRVRIFATPSIAARQASLSIANSWSLPKLMSIDGDAIQPSILCRPLFLLPPIPPSIRSFPVSQL